jgi:hypothetical protein
VPATIKGFGTTTSMGFVPEQISSPGFGFHPR